MAPRTCAEPSLGDCCLAPQRMLPRIAEAWAVAVLPVPRRLETKEQMAQLVYQEAVAFAMEVVHLRRLHSCCLAAAQQSRAPSPCARRSKSVVANRVAVSQAVAAETSLDSFGNRQLSTLL